MDARGEGVPVVPGRRIVLPVGRTVVLLAAAALASLAVTAQPAGGRTAQQPTVAVSPATVAPGGTVTFSGTVPPDPGGDPCSDPGALITITSTIGLFPPDGFGPQVALDGDGGFQTTYTVPAATPPGGYSIGLRCGGANLGGSADLQVADPTAPPATQPAPTSTAATATSSTTTTAAGESSTTTSRRTTTTASSAGATGDDGDGTPWIVLGAAALLVAAGGAGFVALRRRQLQDQDDEQPSGG